MTVTTSLSGIVAEISTYPFPACRSAELASQPGAYEPAAAIAPQVNDEGVGPGDKFHRGGDRGAGNLRHRHPAQVEVADVAVQALYAVDAEVVQAPYLAHPQPSRLTARRLGAVPVRPLAIGSAGTAPGLSPPWAGSPAELSLPCVGTSPRSWSSP
jgi:hypothetical protein